MTYPKSIRHGAFALLLLCSAGHLRADAADDTTTNLVTVTATITKIIGTFDTYRIPVIGDTLTLNLADLPKHQIRFSSGRYIPFGNPDSRLSIDSVDRTDWGPTSKYKTVNLVTSHAVLVITIGGLVADFTMGDAVTVRIIKTNGRFHVSVAELEGTVQ